MCREKRNKSHKNIYNKRIAMKLWDKGYTTDELVERFTVGRDRELDLLLARADVLGNLAQARMLCSIGLLTDTEEQALTGALRTLFRRIEAGEFAIDAGVEDIHSQVEGMLTAQCGDAGKKIHTGRSRNDQVLLDLKLFTRHALFHLLEEVQALFDLLMRRAEENKDILIPGYTHWQVAMPSSFGLWFGAYAESLADDLLVLKSAYDLVNTNPLGSGAGYGSSIPLNRELTTRLLAFGDLAYNSVYAQMQRGKMEKLVLSALGAVATTLGRLAADVCLFASGNFGFVRLPDRYTTGSSIMPHKKNPDVFELIRARCNLLQGAPYQLTVLTANLTSGYFRDMQLTKEVYLPAFGELSDCLTLARLVLQEMELNREVLSDDRYRHLFTVEEVNALVAAGVPFREAYRQVGEAVINGTWEGGGMRGSHTHAGSIHRLCLPEIRARFERHLAAWDRATVEAAEQSLIEGMAG